MASVDEKLEALEGDLGAIKDAAGAASTIIDALKAGDNAKAVEAALEFFKSDDELKELKGIKEKVDGGETIQSAIKAANGPALAKELVESTVREIKGSIEKVKELVPNIAAAGKAAAEKAKNMTSEAGSWSFAEKMGTPEAVRNTGDNAKKVADGAEEAKTKLEALTESIKEVGS